MTSVNLSFDSVCEYIDVCITLGLDPIKIKTTIIDNKDAFKDLRLKTLNSYVRLYYHYCFSERILFLRNFEKDYLDIDFSKLSKDMITSMILVNDKLDIEYLFFNDYNEDFILQIVKYLELDVNEPLHNNYSVLHLGFYYEYFKVMEYAIDNGGKIFDTETGELSKFPYSDYKFYEDETPHILAYGSSELYGWLESYYTSKNKSDIYEHIQEQLKLESQLDTPLEPLPEVSTMTLIQDMYDIMLKSKKLGKTSLVTVCRKLIVKEISKNDLQNQIVLLSSLLNLPSWRNYNFI